MKTVAVPTGGMWPEANFEIVFDMECSESFSIFKDNVCKHCFDFHKIRKESDDGELVGYQNAWFCKHVVVIHDKIGGSVGVCADCIIEAINNAKKS